MSVAVKICGLNDPVSVKTAVEGGAAFVGLVFYPPSPRALDLETAASLAALVPAGVIKVGLFVDADDATIDTTLADVPLDMLQLHGSETPARVGEIRRRTGLPVMKAIKVAGEEDVETAGDYVGVADRLLFDAKAPPDLKGALPGGNALRFDWTLLGGRRWDCPWMLSGGLDAANVAEAVAISHTEAVDVSSGVESAPGVKDPARIRAFLDAAKAL